LVVLTITEFRSEQVAIQDGICTDSTSSAHARSHLLTNASVQLGRSSMPVEHQTPAIEDRAVEILTLLADRGQHRAPSTPGLIIAATAELAGLTVLHVDKDFDLIAEITGQPVERLNVDQAAVMGNDTDQAGHDASQATARFFCSCDGRAARWARASRNTCRADNRSGYSSRSSSLKRRKAPLPWMARRSLSPACSSVMASFKSAMPWYQM
jgi:hypothetical protein